MIEILFSQIFGKESRVKSSFAFMKISVNVLLTLVVTMKMSSALIAQTNYNITVNSPDAYQGNLFYQKGGNQPRNVMIISQDGEELFVENWGMKGWDFKVNANNHLTYFDRASDGWFVMDSLHQVVDSVYALNGYVADNHDFMALPNGNYVLFCYDIQTYAMDTVVEGGDPEAQIEGVIIQELDSEHNLVFEWSSWNHFHITDNPYYEPWTNNEMNFIHTNSIDIDYDGHFVISSRNLDEITKIHRTTGEIIWRWGGTQTDFEFINDYPFTHQHTLRCLGNDNYLLYDNGNHSSQYTGLPNISRAVEYHLDLDAMTCENIWEYTHPDFYYTPSIGSTQRLPNGNTLVDFGNLQLLNTGSVLVEVTPENEVVFQLEYDNGGNLYRAHKFDWFFTTEDQIESVSLNSYQASKHSLGYYNTIGQKVEFTSNTLLFELFSDGTVEKVFSINF